MAGRGSRFQAVAAKNPEFQKPKPLITVQGLPMIVWAVKSLPFIDFLHNPAKTSFVVRPKDLTFICLEEHEEKFKIISVLQSLFSKDISIVLIPEVTRGATETALTAKVYIAENEPLIISDSDHFFIGTPYYKTIEKMGSKVAGIIPVFKPPDDDPKWSFTLFDGTKRALAVGEKDATLAKLGAYANIGAYYFSKGNIFIDEAEAMIRENDMYGATGKQEFYIAPIYQRLIKKGFGVQAAIIEKVWGLGTPSDLEFFLAHYHPAKSS
ncbi:MAG: hypothetical protein Q8Q49_00070 [bacterium]|nr:hypothetical protein [bacterium]